MNDEIKEGATAGGGRYFYKGGQWFDRGVASAPAAEKPVGVVEDLSRATIPTAIRSVTAAGTAVPTILDFANKGLEEGLPKAAEFASRGVAEALFGKGQEVGQWFADRAAEKKKLEAIPLDPGARLKEYELPTYSKVMGGIENKIIGPLYKAQTPPVKYAASVGELLASAGSKAPQLVKAILGGVGAEAAGQASEGEWYEPYMRMVGLLGGVAAPTAARAVVSPGAFSKADKAKLDQSKLVSEHVNLPSGVFIQSPGMTKLEGSLLPYYPFKSMKTPAQEKAASDAMFNMVSVNPKLAAGSAGAALATAPHKSGVVKTEDVVPLLSPADKMTKFGKFVQGAENLGVGKPLPSYSVADVPGARAAMSIAGGLAGYKYGGGWPALAGATAGAFKQPLEVAEHVGKTVAAPLVLNPASQAYLKNQLWKPSQGTALDPKSAAYLLGSQAGPTYDDYFYPIQ